MLLIEDDSHRYKVDQPLLNGDPVHGIGIAVPNLTRLVVEGETINEWLKLTIDPRRNKTLFSWQRMRR